MKKWLSLRVGRQESKHSHLFATTYTGRSSGAAMTACGVSPYERLNAGEVRFSEPSPRLSRCADCNRVDTEAIKA